MGKKMKKLVTLCVMVLCLGLVSFGCGKKDAPKKDPAPAAGGATGGAAAAGGEAAGGTSEASGAAQEEK